MRLAKHKLSLSVEFNKFNNTGAQMIDHMTLKYLKIAFLV